MTRQSIFTTSLLAALLSLCSCITLAQNSTDADDNARVLVFTKTAGFVHKSIPTGAATIAQLGEDNGFSVDTTSDATRFSDEGLSPYAAVVFMSTTGDVLDSVQQDAFERFIAGGKGYVGIHAAADTEYDWPWYRGLVGRQFIQHPQHQRARIHTIDSEFPAAMASFGDSLTLYEEWYEYTVPYAVNLTDIMRVDTTTYSTRGYKGAESMGVYHPLAWYHEYEGGRAFYTGIGHMDETFEMEAFRDHLLAGLHYAISGAMRQE